MEKSNILELQKLLSPIVEKIGQAGIWVHEVFYRQVYVDALIINGGWLIFWLFLLFLNIKYKKSATKFTEKHELYNVKIIYFFSYIVIILNILNSLSEIIRRLINPNYYVIESILRIIKN